MAKKIQRLWFVGQQRQIQSEDRDYGQQLGFELFGTVWNDDAAQRPQDIDHLVYPLPGVKDTRIIQQEIGRLRDAYPHATIWIWTIYWDIDWVCNAIQEAGGLELNSEYGIQDCLYWIAGARARGK